MSEFDNSNWPCAALSSIIEQQKRTLPDYARRVECAADQLRRGGLVVMLDDAGRENEGDLVCAAQHCSPELVNFMKINGRGLICVPLEAARLDALRLPLMATENSSHFGTNFTVSVDAVDGATTGISASDMSVTIKLLADPATKPEHLGRPGHVFPLRANPSGTLMRRGQTEGGVDLCRIAGLEPAAVLCEICSADGSMAREPELREYAQQHGLPLLHVQDIVRYRLLNERLIEAVAPARLPTQHGEFTLIGYEVPMTGEHHVALVYGEIDPGQPVLVRVHSECLTGDVFHSRRCDCGSQLDWALRQIAEAGSGVLVYLRQEGRGIGLMNKVRAYRLQDQGMDTIEANLALGLPADSRDYSIGAQILKDLGVRRLRLITNNPEKIAGMEAFGLDVDERVPVPMEVMLDSENARYLEIKSSRMGHMYEFTVQDSGAADGSWRWG